MNEILATIRQRFVKGLREAPYEFFAPIIVASQGIRLGLRIITRQLDTAMIDAREKAYRSKKHKE
ncbi:hypothetical protein [Rhodanobacter sp. MP1X3]|uniref:hypothetical protein n=1 Tax=Rhodanobacter sp. MP1X3 TaxID=2723086 RepID=UPI001610AB53|nr:hypothetical protein [Rhodanobacter sp. MP1X3]MBB6244112.1 hypothetical protein [Rhodanobacter sp. MP1X3]